MPTSLITAMDLADSAPGLVPWPDAGDVEGLRESSRELAGYALERAGRDILGHAEKLESYIRTFKTLGLDSTDLEHAKAHLKHLGAILSAANFETLPLASQAFADSWGDFNNALLAIQKATL